MADDKGEENVVKTIIDALGGTQPRKYRTPFLSVYVSIFLAWHYKIVLALLPFSNAPTYAERSSIISNEIDQFLNWRWLIIFVATLGAIGLYYGISWGIKWFILFFENKGYGWIQKKSYGQTVPHSEYDALNTLYKNAITENQTLVQESNSLVQDIEKAEARIGQYAKTNSDIAKLQENTLEKNKTLEEKVKNLENREITQNKVLEFLESIITSDLSRGATFERLLELAPSIDDKFWSEIANSNVTPIFRFPDQYREVVQILTELKILVVGDRSDTVPSYRRNKNIKNAVDFIDIIRKSKPKTSLSDAIANYRAAPTRLF